MDETLGEEGWGAVRAELKEQLKGSAIASSPQRAATLFHKASRPELTLDGSGSRCNHGSRAAPVGRRHFSIGTRVLELVGGRVGLAGSKMPTTIVKKNRNGSPRSRDPDDEVERSVSGYILWCYEETARRTCQPKRLIAALGKLNFD